MKATPRDPKDVLRYGLALVFLSAAVFRIVNPAEAYEEMQSFNLPDWFAWFIVALEVFAGVSLVLKRLSVIALILLALFMVFTLTLSLIMSPDLIAQVGEVFTYDHTPTDFALHLTYLIVIVYLILAIRKR
ncbi:MAG: DoxX family protein [Spirochaetota bacterium]